MLVEGAEGATVFFTGAVGAGETAGAGVGLFDLNQERLAGVGETVGAGDAAGVAAVAGAFFLCLGLATLGDASGLAAGVGDWATNEVTENPISAISRPINLFMAGAYRQRQALHKAIVGMTPGAPAVTRGIFLVARGR